MASRHTGRPRPLLEGLSPRFTAGCLPRRSPRRVSRLPRCPGCALREPGGTPGWWLGWHPGCTAPTPQGGRSEVTMRASFPMTPCTGLALPAAPSRAPPMTAYCSPTAASQTRSSACRRKMNPARARSRPATPTWRLSWGDCGPGPSCWPLAPRVLTALGLMSAALPFAHGAEHRIAPKRRLVDSCHCSRYNTQTRRRSEPMFHAIFARARVPLPWGRSWPVPL
jgi:hypothetical protein